MRLATAILSIIGALLLFLVADLRWGFVPLRVVGLESGLIVASLALFAGLAISAVAMGLAFLDLRRARSFHSKWLLAWSCTLAFGFALQFFV